MAIVDFKTYLNEAIEDLFISDDFGNQKRIKYKTFIDDLEIVDSYGFKKVENTIRKLTAKKDEKGIEAAIEKFFDIKTQAKVADLGNCKQAFVTIIDPSVPKQYRKKTLNFVA